MPRSARFRSDLTPPGSVSTGDFRDGMTFPPFVDAYQTPHGSNVGWSYHDFVAALKRTASQWVPADCQRLTGKPSPKIGKATVVACGWWGDARYVLLDDPNDKAKGWHVLRHNYPDTWDQT